MVLHDITPEFFAFWNRAEGRSAEEQRRLWYELYEEPHRDLFDVSGGRLGTPEALPSALDRFAREAIRLREIVPDIRTAIENTGPELSQLFGRDDLDLRWVLLVGMYWSDGWVVEIDGQRTCFIAVEMLAQSPSRAEILLAHEAAHIAHSACLGEGWRELDTLGAGLFLEGLATLASAQLVPNLGEATYPWAGLERTPRGLSLPAWLAQCEAVWPVVRSQIAHELHATDPEVSAPYFLGDQAPADQPERVGYYAGFRLVSALAQEHTIAELARWSSERILHEVERELRG